MSKITKVTLGDLIEFQRGYDLPKSAFQFGTVPVISSNGILGYHNQAKTKAPGITIGRSGTVGLPHYIDVDFFPHNTALFVKDFKGNDPKYLFYLIKTLGLHEFKTGSGVPTMNRNHLHPLAVNAHLDLATQQKIAAVLSALDAKIELNNRINTELEAMAKTLYDYWFVQFDFPNADGKPYKATGGKMVFNQQLKKNVPALNTWKQTSLSEIINIFDSKRIPLSSTQRAKRKGIFPYYGATSIMDYIDSFIFDGEYILLAEDGSVMNENGNPIIQYIWGKTWVNNHAHVLQPKKADDKEYLFHLLKTISVVQIMTGSVQKKINQENLMNVDILLPDIETLDKFSKFASPIRKRIIKLTEENQTLAELRDWLLPMLMNGQVRV